MSEKKDDKKKCKICGTEYRFRDYECKRFCSECGVVLSRQKPKYNKSYDVKCRKCNDSGIIEIMEMHDDNPALMAYACSCPEGIAVNLIEGHTEDGKITPETKCEKYKPFLEYAKVFGDKDFVQHDIDKQNNMTIYKFLLNKFDGKIPDYSAVLK